MPAGKVCSSGPGSGPLKYQGNDSGDFHNPKVLNHECQLWLALDDLKKSMVIKTVIITTTLWSVCRVARGRASILSLNDFPNENHAPNSGTEVNIW